MSSSLALTNDELVRAVLHTAGLGRDIGDLDDATEADVRAIIRTGLRRFRYPLVNGGVYKWRWLERFHSVSFTALYSTGTITLASGTVTLTGGTFPSWAADGFILVDGHVVFVTERTDDTHVEVNHTELAVTGETYQLFRYRYDLPPDFDEWSEGLVYQNATDNWMLSPADEADLRLRYAVQYNYNYRTSHYAVTFAGSETSDLDGTAKIMFWPIPQPNAVAQGVYAIALEDNLPVDLRSPGAAVIQCGPKYAEAALEAILAAAEEYNDDTEGVHEKRFQELLLVAIQHDRATTPPIDFSQNLRNITARRPLPTSIDFTNAII